jgi:hypothetical protein
MGLVLSLGMLAVVFGGIGYYLYSVVVGAKKTWNDRVASVARAQGARVQPGAHGFAQVLVDRPDGSAAAFVNNMVASEPALAPHLRGYNTNGWLTIVCKRYVAGAGPGFLVHAGAARGSFALGDPAFDAGHHVRALTSAERIAQVWSPRAREIMQRSGRGFQVASGGQAITIVTRGVAEDARQVLDMLELAHELARA